MSVLCIKNILGEDLIGEVSTTMAGDYIIERPFMIVITPNPSGNGSFGVMMMPYLQFADEHKFTFPGGSILFSYEPSLELANRYRDIAGSGVVIAKPDLSIVK